MFKLLVCDGILMFKDRPLAHIVVTDIGGYSADQIEPEGRYFPLEMRKECSGHTLKRFCEERLTPPTRQGLDRRLAERGYDEYSHAAILIESNGRDCSDPFWVKFPTGPQTWKDVWVAVGVYNRK